MFSEIAKRAKVVDAKPLPDVMIFPSSITLEQSSKNIYGVLPPTNAEGELVPLQMLMDDRMWMADKSFTFDGTEFTQGHYDGAWFGNSLENRFSKALDRANL
ncbi:MAG: hypothetical protein IPH40_06835 [Polaromonas sp.]|nr:hypothetical protein [Polaromonas sp.]